MVLGPILHHPPGHPDCRVGRLPRCSLCILHRVLEQRDFRLPPTAWGRRWPISRLHRIRAAPTPGVRPRRPADTSRSRFACRYHPARSTFCRSPRRASPSGVGYLEYRVYLPATGDASHLALPHVTVEDGGSSQQLRACTSHTMAIPPPAARPLRLKGQPRPPAAPAAPRRFSSSGPRSSTYFPNPETAYLLAYMTPPTASEVVVVTGKAPTSPPGAHPSIWPSARDQVRYWSMCVNIGVGTDPVVVNHLPGGQTDLGCRADDATKLSAGGTYTYVIGTEAQRTTIERVAGVTFLPLSLAQPAAPLYLLAMRYTLANPTFDSAPQNIVQTGERSGSRSDHGGVLSARPGLLVERPQRRGASACG